jgi:anti-sigma regulatory factor (Ser/Thr protein kinase)
VASQLDFTYDVVKDVELAVGEACANAVEHVPDESCNEILVRFSIDPTQLMVEVVDRGQGFDPESAAAADGEGKQGWDDPGGLGLVVIRGVMDDVTIECDEATGTCVRMVKYRSR